MSDTTWRLDSTKIHTVVSDMTDLLSHRSACCRPQHRVSLDACRTSPARKASLFTSHTIRKQPHLLLKPASCSRRTTHDTVISSKRTTLAAPSSQQYARTTVVRYNYGTFLHYNNMQGVALIHWLTSSHVRSHVKSKYSRYGQLREGTIQEFTKAKSSTIRDRRTVSFGKACPLRGF